MTETVESGKLRLSQSSADNNYYSTEFFNLNLKSDYRIETKIEHISGIDNYGFGLIWGLEDYQNYNSFEISDDGHFCVLKIEDNQVNKVISWKKCPEINRDGANILSVEKNKGKLNFAINDNHVSSAAPSSFVSSFFGRHIGYIIHKNQTFEVDYLKVSADQGKSIIPSIADMFMYNEYRKSEYNIPIPENYWDK